MIQECKNSIVEDDFHEFLFRNCVNSSELYVKDVNARCHFLCQIFQNFGLIRDIAKLIVDIFNRSHDFFEARRIFFGKSGGILNNRHRVGADILQIFRVVQNRIHVGRRLLNIDAELLEDIARTADILLLFFDNALYLFYALQCLLRIGILT